MEFIREITNLIHRSISPTNYEMVKSPYLAGNLNDNLR